MRAPDPSGTLFARLPGWVCRMVLVVIALLVIWPARPHPALVIPGERSWGAKEADTSDLKLYKAIVSDIGKGQDYYQAAAVEHRARSYPTYPAPVFREPTLAWLLAVLHFQILQLGILFGLYGVLVIAFYRELTAGKKPLPVRLSALAVAITGTSVIGVPAGIYWHEVWATLLMALSLLSYRKTRFWPAVLAGLAACLFRELALPYLLVMALFAICQRRWKELAAWSGAIILFLALFSVHLYFASHLHRPGDLVSQGWLGLGGWDFAIATAKWNVFLHMLPYPLIALAMCLGVIGLVGARDERAQRAALTVVGYLSAFLVVGRPENFYWGILYAPMLSAGFLLAPAAIRDLMHNAFPAFSGFQKKAEETS